MQKLLYVVTGTGRSGTVYLANLLTRSGIPCGHESIFTPWGLDEALARLGGRSPIHVSAISLEACGAWLPDALGLVADSSYMAAPFLDHAVLAYAHVLHVVRHPMDVINSFVVGLDYFKEWVPPDPWHRFIYTHVPELRLDYDPLERAALYYVRWNRMIEERSRGKRYFFCRLEDGAGKLLPQLGVRCRDEALLAHRAVNTRMAGKPAYSFHDIPAGPTRRELEEIAGRYGYPLGPPETAPEPAPQPASQPAPQPAPGRGLWRAVRSALACWT